MGEARRKLLAARNGVEVKREEDWHKNQKELNRKLKMNKLGVMVETSNEASRRMKSESRKARRKTNKTKSVSEADTHVGHKHETSGGEPTTA